MWDLISVLSTDLRYRSITLSCWTTEQRISFQAISHLSVIASCRVAADEAESWLNKPQSLVSAVIDRPRNSRPVAKNAVK